MNDNLFALGWNLDLGFALGTRAFLAGKLFTNVESSVALWTRYTDSHISLS
jgi:hypothetical protein